MRTGPLRLRVGAAAVVGRWRGDPAASTIAVLLDGAVQAVLPAAAAGFTWSLPAAAFGRLLDIVDPSTGASLLGGPIAWERWRAITWEDWAQQGEAVLLRFGVSGRAAPAPELPIPVELWGADGRYAQGFAVAEEGRRVARLRLDRLAPGRADLVLRPRVGAALLDVPIAVAAGQLGHVDAGEPWRVSGWLLPQGPGPAMAALYLDGKLAGTAVADAPRADVAAAGLGDGRAGFAFPLALPLDRPVLVDVRAGRDGPSLSGSPYLRPATRWLGHFDSIDGAHATGWAFHPDREVTVEAVCDGAVVGRATADLPRGDLAEAGLPAGARGFRIPLEAATDALLGRGLSVRLADGPTLPGSPQLVAGNPNIAAFAERGRGLAPATLARLRRMIAHRTQATLVSIVMPVFDTRREWLAEAVASVRAQWSPHWELICVDDGSRAAHVAPMLAAYARQDRRIRFVQRAENGGIARAVNDGIAAAAGTLVAVLDHDDVLEPDAVYHVARAAQETGADLLYSDEVLTGAALDRFLEVRARPAWSHDYYLSHPYAVHWIVARTELARRLGGWDAALPISADVDFVLRAVEQARAVAHIPRVLYRWRTVAGSAGHRAQAEVGPTMRRVVAAHLGRLGLPARPEPAGPNQLRLEWPDPGGEVLVVIPTRDRADLLERCLASLDRTAAGEPYRVVIIDHRSREAATQRLFQGLDARHSVMRQGGPFNFARLNNRAVAAHAGTARFVLFLNNDIEAIEPGWLGRLRSLAARPDVGAVGPLLLYGNGRVQHAGALVGFAGAAEHAQKHVPFRQGDGSRNPGYNCTLTATRDFSAVTAACLMMRLEAFNRVGGFDERFAVGFNDTDLCLRLRAAGLRVLYDGQSVLLHHESATRSASRAILHPEDDARLRARWPGFFSQGDPFYSPLLSQSGADHQLRTDRGWKGKLGPRVMTLR